MGIEKKMIYKLNKFILGNIKPDLIFLNLVNKKNLKLRLGKRINKNKYDRFSISFYNKVQNGFIKQSKNKSCYIIVNSKNKLKEISQIK